MATTPDTQGAREAGRKALPQSDFAANRWRYPLAVLAAGGTGTVSAIAFSRLGADPMLVAATVGALAGLACLLVALARFELFVLALLAVRPTLDGLSQGTQVSSAGMSSPSVMVGLVFVGTSTLWLAVRFVRRQLLPPTALSWSWITLVAAALLSCLVSDYPFISMAASLRLAAAALMFVLLEQALRTGIISLRGLLAAVAVAGALVVCWTAVQVVAGGGAEDPWTGLTRVTGPFVHPSVLAKFLVIMALLLGSRLATSPPGRLPNSIIVPALAVVLVCLGLTYTRAAWLACAVGAAYIMWQRKPALLPVFAVATSVIVLSVPSVYARVSDLWVSEPPAPGAPDTSLAWRMTFWQHLVPLAQTSPVNGRGLDSISLIGGQDLPAHNIWIQAWVEMGFVGMAALIGLAFTIFVTLRRMRESAPRSSLVLAAGAISLAMLTMSVSENLLNETTTLWYFACAVSAARATTYEENP